ncbi:MULTISPECIES: hypothetical protein [Nocardia]|uniref:hypothetical protein n=1 Tax=Nocardia TaxID=1817 RepID=UPI000D69D2AA|nr:MULTISPECIES: hypothetical protein [Nocardia]
MALSSPTTAIPKVSIGSTDIKKISIGTTEIWTAVFTPASAYRNGSYAVGGTYGQVTGWAADPAYPGTVVTSNKVVIPFAGTGVFLTCSIPFSTPSGSFVSHTVTLRLFLDGVAVATGSAASAAGFGGSATATVTATGTTVNNDSLLHVEATGTNSPTLAANAAAYLRAFKP